MLALREASAGHGRAPSLHPAVKQRSDLWGFGTGRHREVGTVAGGCRAKAGADPRGLGDTGYFLVLCHSLQDLKHCGFEVAALKPSKV